MKLTPFLKSGVIIVPNFSFVNCFRIDKASNGGSSIHFSIQRMIRSAADQMRDITPIISIVGIARIAMIPNAIGYLVEFFSFSPASFAAQSVSSRHSPFISNVSEKSSYNTAIINPPSLH